MKRRLMISAALALAATGMGGVTTAADAEVPVHGYAHLERVADGLPCIGIGLALSPLTVFVTADNEGEPSNPVINIGPTPTDECQL